jgi:hypothetical protein
MTELASGAIFGGYRIERVAGRGGMGVVYRATQLGLGRTVALKLIARDIAHDDRFRERFKRESSLAASIDHPNVIPVYEAGETDGALFLSMRWVEGADLLTLIKRGGGLEPEQAARVIDQVAAALDAAHGHGLVHRDVKPANVLVVAGGAEHAYLTDFGLVKRTRTSSDVTQSGEFVGTLDYVAPEQIEGETEASSDVYSLGCVLFHSLTGRVPFQRDSEIAKIAAHLHESPPSPSEVTPAVPRPFDPIVTRAMAKNRTERFQTAGELGHAAMVAADSTSRRRPTERTRGASTTILVPDGATRPGLRRLPRPWVAGLALFLVAGAVAGLLALAGIFEGSGGDEQAIGDGTLLKARGDPGVYIVKAGAKFLISPQQRDAFFAGEGQKIRLVSSRTLHSVPDIPREGSFVRRYQASLVWVIHDGHRSPVKRPGGAGAVVVPSEGLTRIPLRPGGHRTSLVAAAPRHVREDQDFRVTAQARSPAGVPTGICYFFRLSRNGLVERAKDLETRHGRCTAILRLTNVRHARYAVHFYGDRGWRFPTALTNPIDVQSR